MELQNELSQWNGESTDPLRMAYQEHHFEPGFIAEVLSYCHMPELQTSATWLIKYHLEHEEQLTDEEMHQLYRIIPDLEEWEARMHFLQIIPYVPVNDQEKVPVEQFIRECLADRNKFLRAWAYNALFVLSQQHSEYVVDVKKLFRLALKKEAPSIKTRIKNILQQHNLENQSP